MICNAIHSGVKIFLKENFLYDNMGSICEYFLENKVLQKLKLSKNVLPNYYIFLIEKNNQKDLHDVENSL